MRCKVEEEKDDSGTLYASKLYKQILRSKVFWKTWATTKEGGMCVSYNSRFTNLLLS